MGILEGKKLLITGVLMDTSIAFHVAKIAQEEGAEVVLTSFGRTTKITKTIAKRLPTDARVIELDVTNQRRPRQPRRARQASTSTDFDGVLHSIGFAPQGRLQLHGGHLGGRLDGAARLGLLLKSLAVAALPLMAEGGSVVGLTFDAKFAWPVYDWMGVAKAAFESTNRYLARDLGPKGSAATSWPPARSARRPPSRSPASRRSRTTWGEPRPARLGRQRPDPGGAGPARRCSPTGSRRRRARSSTSTAACTRWASDAAATARP